MRIIHRHRSCCSIPFLDLPLINCEIELDLSSSKEYIISEISIIPAVVGNPDANPPASDRAGVKTTGATFQINNTKRYVSVVTLSANDNIKFLETIKQGFRRRISWNKYRSEITTQAKINNLDYLIDPTCKNINRLFLISLKNCNSDSIRKSSDKYYMPLIEIKDFNALIITV